ncbi:sensor histidine kinase [Catellatospora chokoriensis]|uniref:histidine kinase n=1 Tax=Catellatospora chokoriensis TaxID=310353 RepID=A0A8J3NSJ7_9ACTN|nr:HAMP domain-containing sensor histidine kinase [Catellatospora chokoriensis]GIF91137.1 two-component sensor histidine kinase [Catellatospora chokoriensis]
MSFRLRVVALVMFIAVTATAATAWLTLQQASREFDRTVSASAEQQALITTGLADFARTRGGWDGVAERVRELSLQTGQRIQVTTVSGAVVADSDTLAGTAARGVTGPALLVDPRPTWQPLPKNDTSIGSKTVLLASWEYRIGLHLASCLAKAGIGVRLADDRLGIPVPVPVTYSAQSKACEVESRAQVTLDRDPAFEHELQACDANRSGQTVPCLQDAFSRAVGAYAPAQMRVYVGAAEQPRPRLPVKSIVLTAVVVALTAVGASWLLSRRVLRPIGALTAASAQVGDGRLTERVPVRGHDELAGLARSFNRMADSLQRSEELQRRMISDVAHELRTPLANLRGYLEALKDGVLPPSPELFESLHDEAVLQQRIVDDLQDLALAEAGALTYQQTRLDLGELVATCKTAHAALAHTSGVALTVESTGPRWVHADPDRLRQVIGNLVRNAVAATAAGGTITLTVAADGDRHVVRVADTGSGIAEADLPFLFDRLWRADRARGRAGQGTGSGLGLSIARQIVADHGGTIDVVSVLGVGTTFTIWLPAA